MKTITLEKLQPFVLLEEEPKDMYKPLKQIHTANTFSIATNGHIAGIIYNGEDHDLNYTFGNGMDVITSAFKKGHREKDIDHEIVIKRKYVLDTITEQFKELKAQIKEKHKISIRDYNAITKYYIDCKSYKLYISTRNEYIVNDKAKVEIKYNSFIVSKQPEIYVEFNSPKYDQQEYWESCFKTNYIVDFLNFMQGYDMISIWTGGSKIHAIRCEEQDREVLLVPIRM